MSNKPVKKFRIGTVEIAEWQQQGQSGNVYSSYTIRNSYKDKQSGEWKDSKSFMLSDIQKLKTLCDSVLLSFVKEEATGQAQGLNNPQFQQNTNNVQQTFQDPWPQDQNVSF